jgi:putative FmdB family regulatory protein
MKYQYKCKCGSELEIERSIHAEESAPICMDCHESMSRVWNAPPITFSGSGFYTTDN